mmetsp:Transcript_102302/g.312900  ORF Transcript_102302/g.312900 Transcript_102302/m.312900 type:complete len:321 (-) Transcript_102302:535-1497(-)
MSCERVVLHLGFPHDRCVPLERILRELIEDLSLLHPRLSHLLHSSGLRGVFTFCLQSRRQILEERSQELRDLLLPLAPVRILLFRHHLRISKCTGHARHGQLRRLRSHHSAIAGQDGLAPIDVLPVEVGDGSPGLAGQEHTCGVVNCLFRAQGRVVQPVAHPQAQVYLAAREQDVLERAIDHDEFRPLGAQVLPDALDVEHDVLAVAAFRGDVELLAAERVPEPVLDALDLLRDVEPLGPPVQARLVRGEAVDPLCPHGLGVSALVDHREEDRIRVENRLRAFPVHELVLRTSQTADDNFAIFNERQIHGPRLVGDELMR